jgi:hypothetical protein
MKPVMEESNNGPRWVEQMCPAEFRREAAFPFHSRTVRNGYEALVWIGESPEYSQQWNAWVALLQ